MRVDKQNSHLYKGKNWQTALTIFAIHHYRRHFLFGQVSITIHKYNVNKVEFECKDLIVMKWPAHSPYYSSPENLCAFIHAGLMQKDGCLKKRKKISIGRKPCLIEIPIEKLTKYCIVNAIQNYSGFAVKRNVVESLITVTFMFN